MRKQNKKRKIFIIGSTVYVQNMKDYKFQMELDLHNEVRLPLFDNAPMSEIELCQINKDNIQWSDEVHMFYDGRSMGTVFDFGMCFALNKKVLIVHMNEKTIPNLMRQYERNCI